MKTRAHKEVEHLLGREVEYGLVPASNNYIVECADCKKPSKYLIVEKGIDEDHNYYRAWYYCGECMVG